MFYLIIHYTARGSTAAAAFKTLSVKARQSPVYNQAAFSWQFMSLRAHRPRSSRPPAEFPLNGTFIDTDIDRAERGDTVGELFKALSVSFQVAQGVVDHLQTHRPRLFLL